MGLALRSSFDKDIFQLQISMDDPDIDIEVEQSRGQLCYIAPYLESIESHILFQAGSSYQVQKRSSSYKRHNAESRVVRFVNRRQPQDVGVLQEPPYFGLMAEC